MIFSLKPAATAGLFLAVPSGVRSWEDTCAPFHKIYADGTELCEKMFDDAFSVTEDEENAYTMWFFDGDNNPNDAITQRLFGGDVAPDQCAVQYFHKKGGPSPEGDGMAECHPWKENACCHSDTVGSEAQIRESYGEGYEWDRCGPMSAACERFFVQEACFYECEPNVSYFRKYNDTNHTDYNEWQLGNMPIKKSYCDAWYTACYNDYFCGKGNFFECKAHYWANEADRANEAARVNEAARANEAALLAGTENSATTYVVSLSIVGALLVVGAGFALFLVYREKKGTPVFGAEELAAKTAADVS